MTGGRETTAQSHIATYTCHDCGFVFSRAGEVLTCPLCENHSVTAAVEAEQMEHEKKAGASRRKAPPELRLVKTG